MFRVVFLIVIMLGIRQFEPWAPGRVRDRGRWGGGGGAKKDEKNGGNLKTSKFLFFQKSIYIVPKCL